jgi:hypothetical protein
VLLGADGEELDEEEVSACVRAKLWWKHQRECVKATTETTTA